MREWKLRTSEYNHHTDVIFIFNVFSCFYLSDWREKSFLVDSYKIFEVKALAVSAKSYDFFCLIFALKYEKS